MKRNNRYGYKIGYRENGSLSFIRYFMTYTYKQALFSLEHYRKYPQRERETGISVGTIFVLMKPKRYALNGNAWKRKKKQSNYAKKNASLSKTLCAPLKNTCRWTAFQKKTTTPYLSQNRQPSLLKKATHYPIALDTGVTTRKWQEKKR